MRVIWTIGRKEVTDAFKNKIFVIILVMLLALTAISIILGSFQVRAAVNQYNSSIDFLKSLGKTELPPFPSLNPISVSKNFVNYIGILGALLAMILGNESIVKEKRGGTLKLVLCRSVFRDMLLNGKLFGNLAIVGSITLASAAITLVSVFVIGRVALSTGEIVRMCLFFLMTFLYMSFFLVLGIMMAILTRNGNKALLLTMIIWLILAFVLPQIGDTMDMDNQLPGGFFAQMGMTKDQEHQVLAKFKFYETLRDSIEEMSPTKHYERIGFALLNVKLGFENNTPIQVLGLKWIDVLGLTAPAILFWLISYMAFLRREDIFND